MSSPSNRGDSSLRHGLSDPTGGLPVPGPGQVLKVLLSSLLPGLCMWCFLFAWGLSDLDVLETTPLLEDRNGNFLCETGGSTADLGFWDARVPADSFLVRSFVALEDRRFWFHPGLDPWSAGRALANNLAGLPRQGASTIAMQVVRLQHPALRTFGNKGLESLGALLMTFRHGRSQVLRQYLRLVPQGNRIHGVAYAARRYFQKPLADLDIAESVMLTSLSRFPGRCNLFSWKGFETARARSRMVLQVLLQTHAIDRDEYASGLRQLSAMHMPVKEARAAERTHFVLRALEEEARLEKAAGSGSLVHDRAVRSSLDPDIQELCQQTARRVMRDQRSHGARNLALMVADRKNGQVLAYLGSESYFDQDHAGAINYARTPRSSGSTLKPFIYALGLDSGVFSPASVLADLPFSVFSTRGEYRVANFDQSWLGPMLYRRALANSRNIPALRVLEGLGAKAFWDLLTRLHLPQDDRGPDYYGYGMILGGIYVTLEDLVAAYGTLASDGGDFHLDWFARDPGTRAPGMAGGTGGADRPSGFSPAFSSRASRTIMEFLTDNEARSPSFPRLNPMEYPFPVAVKTGTSQGYRDAWTVAVSDRYLVGMWMGNPDNQPMNHVAGLVCASYVQDLLCALQPLAAQGIATVPFAHPADSVPQDLCLLSGRLKGPYCPGWSREWLPRGQEIRDTCQVHRRTAVDRRTGDAPGPTTPASEIRFQVRTILPPEYSLWAARQGYQTETGSPGTQAQRLSLVWPATGARFLLDPDTPRELQTIPLQARAVPQVPLLLWTVNGKEMARLPFPYEARFTLEPGTWHIQARLPDGSLASEEAVVVVE